MATLLRGLIVAVLVMIGSVGPAMACPAMAPGATMAMDAGDPAPPHASPACDMACLACLVQPVPVRVGAITAWTPAQHPPSLAARLAALSPAPDVPPPRTVSV